MAFGLNAETMEKERIRKKGKKITKKREQLWINGRLGLIIDGTAKNPAKLSITKQDLEAVGSVYYTHLTLPTKRKETNKVDRGL